MVDLEPLARRMLQILRRHETRLLLAIVVVVILTALLDSQHNYVYLPGRNGTEIARQTSLLGIFSLGAAIVIIAGGIDLSSGAVICFSGTVCASLLLLLAPEQMRSSDARIDLAVVAAAIAGTLVVGFLIGSLHAWLITVVRLPPFVATLATLVGLRSFARAICKNVTGLAGGGESNQIQIFDARFRYLATSVWIPVALFLLLAFLSWILLSKTVLGRHLYALGGNEQAARLSGIRTDRLKWLAYCASAVLSSVAGILYICEVSVAEPVTAGQGYELRAIAAAVVGGCSLQGGVGTVPGTVLGALFLRIVIDGVAKIIKTGADVYEGLIVGVVVVFAVAFSQTAGRRERTHFFAGGLGLVAAINLSLLAGAIGVLIGPTLLVGKTSLDGKFIGLWAAASLFALLLLVRSPIAGTARRGAAAGLALIVLAAFFALDRGVPYYREYAARSAVLGAGGKMTTNDEGDRVVDFSRTELDDQGLKSVVERLRYVPRVVVLSLAGTRVTDEGTAAIKTLTGLKRLDVSSTKISRRKQRDLSRALPDVEITE